MSSEGLCENYYHGELERDRDKIEAELRMRTGQLDGIMRDCKALIAKRDRYRAAMVNASNILFEAVNAAPLSSCGPLMAAAGNAYQELTAALDAAPPQKAQP